MRTKLEIVWRLREVMAERGLYMTTEIIPQLREWGIDLSREQIYRIATGTPQRLSLELLAALCVTLKCTPNDLIQYRTVSSRRKAVNESESSSPNLKSINPVPVKATRPHYDDED
jgi:DNA-binding Xre family transcriptional regulator